MRASLATPSRAEKGSSRSSRRGPGARARASATRCAWPPERSCGRRLTRSVASTSSSISATRVARMARSRSAEAVSDIGFDAEVREERGLLRDERGAPVAGLAPDAARGVGEDAAVERDLALALFRRCEFLSRPASRRSSVLLPAPEGPKITVQSEARRHSTSRWKLPRRALRRVQARRPPRIWPVE